MVGSAENRASSAPIELGLGLSLANCALNKRHGRGGRAMLKRLFLPLVSILGIYFTNTLFVFLNLLMRKIEYNTAIISNFLCMMDLLVSIGIPRGR